MPGPFFTVIVSTYNRRDMLPRALKSILTQTFTDFELLVIDNGSTDDTRDVVAGFNDHRLKYILNPRPSSSCDGPRNLGIDMARGGFITFLDDDDLWYPQRLEKVRQAFISHPQVQAVCHNENRMVDGNFAGCIKHGPIPDGLLEVLLYQRNCLSPCAVAVKAEVLRKLGGFDLRPEFSAAADYDMWLRMAESGVAVHFIEEPLGEFFFTGCNGCVTDCDFDARVAYIVESHLLRHEKKPLYRISAKGAGRLFWMYLAAGRSLLKGRKIFKALRYIGRAGLFVVLHPMLLFKKILK